MKRTPTTKSLRALAALALPLLSGAALAQPTIQDVFPNGTQLLQATNILSFSAASAGAVINPEGISVQLTCTNIYGRVTVQDLTSASGLTVGGTANARTVTAALSTNVLHYAATIVVTDASSVSVTNVVRFDTLSPTYLVEAEDFNYNFGQYLPEPQVNGYSRELVPEIAVLGVDVQEPTLNGQTVYRDAGLHTEPNGDVPRAKYVNAGLTDYNTGWLDNGDWGNYTRPYPAGLYNVYLRGANGSGGAGGATLSLVTSDPAGYDQTTQLLGSFTVPNTGWQSYNYYALRNPDGSLVQVTLDGSPQTLRLTSSGGLNANFFALFPANTNAPTLHDIHPDGTRLFQRTNTMSFVARSVDSTIAPEDITVELTHTNIAGQGGMTNLTTANGLVITGTPTERFVSLPIRTNAVFYRAVIRVTDAGDNFTETTVRFDTVQPHYVVEAEDFNYGSGQFLPESQTNAYSRELLTELPVEGIDVSDPAIGDGQTAYRDEGLNTEPTFDVARGKYADAGLTDYNVGWFNSGNWGNYTRPYPAGVYNVYLRSASGNAGGGSATLARVTSDRTQPEQTTEALGTFAVPNNGGWQSYAYVPLRNAEGGLVRLTLDGNAQTLRLTSLGGVNANFIALFPADVSIPVISDVRPNGTALFQLTNQLSFVASSPAGINQQDVTVTLNGQPVSGLVFEGSSTSWTVRYPQLPTNALHTVTISVIALNGASQTATVSFDTFDPNAYTFEAEDFDYDAGQFFPDPDLNAYLGLFGQDGIDASGVNATGQLVYRGGGLNTEVTGDILRPAYVDAGQADHSIGWMDAGRWGNYTRPYPAGSYHVYLRGANGLGSAGGASLAKVTSGVGSVDQTLDNLGGFSIPSLGWQAYRWIAMTNSSGGMATITLGGGNETLRLTSAGGLNANFLLLVPASAPASTTTLAVSRTGTTLTISFPTQTGRTYQVQRKLQLGDPQWQSVGAPVVGDGTTKSVTDTITGSSGFYQATITQ